MRGEPMKQAVRKHAPPAPVCTVGGCTRTAELGSRTCTDHVDKTALRALAKARETKVVGSLVSIPSHGENLTVILADGTCAKEIGLILEELATLCVIADPNRSVPTDREGRSHHSHPLPPVTAAYAAKQLESASDRLHREWERLATAVRHPAKPVEPACTACGQRVRIVDQFCGPCGSAILKKHRRGS